MLGMFNSSVTACKGPGTGRSGKESQMWHFTSARGGYNIPLRDQMKTSDKRSQDYF